MFTIMSSEFLEQAWLKSEKTERSPHIVLMTKRFNDVSFKRIQISGIFFLLFRSPEKLSLSNFPFLFVSGSLNVLPISQIFPKVYYETN